jgi:hypothetical protein
MGHLTGNPQGKAMGMATEKAALEKGYNLGNSEDETTVDYISAAFDSSYFFYFVQRFAVLHHIKSPGCFV